MGFYFRKSLRLGPMRVNFSKSGVGASIGIKGLRLTSSATGSTYVTASSHGFYYRQTLGQRKTSLPSTSPRLTSPTQPDHTGTIPTASIETLVDSSSVDVVRQLNENVRKFNPAIAAWLLCLVPIALAGSSGQVGWTALVAVPVALACVLHWMHKNRTTTRLFYELSEVEKRRFSLVQQSLTYLSQSAQVWRIVNEVATSRWKYHAGAGSLIKRTPVRVGTLQIPKVETNLALMGVDLGGITMFFLPDMVLYLQGNTFANIPYDTFKVRQGVTRFMEEGSVPSDAIVTGSTWKYVNKNGGPDRRFSNNRQVPVVKYGVLQFVSERGLNIHLNTSSSSKAADFANCLVQRLTNRS